MEIRDYVVRFVPTGIVRRASVKAMMDHIRSTYWLAIRLREPPALRDGVVMEGCIAFWGELLRTARLLIT